MSETNLFGTDGVRGRFGKFPITRTITSKLGFYISELLRNESGNRSILIGRDTRISGPYLEHSLAEGIIAAKCTPVVSGLVSTPAMAYLISSGKYAGGVMISASHNPYFDNGFKFFDSSGQKIHEKKMEELETKVTASHNLLLQSDCFLDKIKFIDGASIYLNAITLPITSPLKKIIIDCANGSLSDTATRFFRPLSRKLIVLGNKPNGFNINHACGSTNIDFLQKEVIREGADVGFAFDGDGDRLIAVNDLGSIIDGDDILFILAQDMKKKGILKGGVVGTVMSNIGLESALIKLGIPFTRTSVGDQNVLTTLKKLGWSLGGETSGHIIAQQMNVIGDGLACARVLLDIMTQSNSSLSRLTKDIKKRHQEIVNIETQNKIAIFNNQELKRTIYDIESQLNADSRILVRPSGTEPKIRLLVESDNSKVRSNVLKKLTNKIQSLEKDG